MEQQELVRTIERRRQKVQAKRLYKRILTKRVAPLVCTLLTVGLLAKSQITYFSADGKVQAANAGTYTATLRIEESTDLAQNCIRQDTAAVLISGIAYDGVSLGTAQEAEDSLANLILVTKNAAAVETEDADEQENQPDGDESEDENAVSAEDENDASAEEEEESLSAAESIEASESAEQSSKEAEEFDSIFTETEDTVYAIANVNIRASYSEDSKIIGYLFVGDDVTRTAIGNNGWDQVCYYGVTAYICNAYISTTDPLEQTTTEEVSTEQTTTQQTTTQQTTTQQTTTQQTTTEQTTTEEATTTQSSTVTNVSAISLSDDEILMLAAMIYCEAGGESSEGKLAVGNVILNRLRSGYWGSTLEDVLSAAGQFSPYASGRYAQVLAAGPSSSCIEAAKAAASGEMAVPSNYMFFCNASAYSYRYSDYMQIGNVIFYAK